jgi:hypothetical protein
MTPVSRRKFVQQSATVVAGASLPFPFTMSTKKEVFVHQVYFWLKDPNSAADRAALRAGLEKLRAIPVITFSHIGTAAPTRREVIDSSYDFSLLCFFKDGADQDVYQTHPIHLEFVDTCKHLWKRVVVYDAIGEGQD